jgi:hypothetical protein
LSGAILFQRYPDIFFRLHTPKKAPQTANPSPAPVTPTGSLPSIGLQAERQHGDVKLTWNHESSAILSATSGLLSIQDGDVQREIHLDSTLVRGGSLIYSPISDQIQMQFKVQGPQEAPTETVIIVLPKSGSPLIQLNSRSPEVTHRVLDPKPFIPPRVRSSEPEAKPAIVNELPALQPVNSADAHVAISANNEPPAPPVSPAPVQAPLAVSMIPTPQSQRVPVNPVQSEPYFHPPQVIKQVLPKVQDVAPHIYASSSIQVKVSIDEMGTVVKAALLSNGVAPTTVAAVLAAVRQWRFQPARAGDHTLQSEMILTFNITPPNR